MIVDISKWIACLLFLMNCGVSSEVGGSWGTDEQVEHCKEIYQSRIISDLTHGHQITSDQFKVSLFDVHHNLSFSHTHSKRNLIVNIGLPSFGNVIDTAMLQLNISSSNGNNCKKRKIHIELHDHSHNNHKEPLYINNFFQLKNWEHFFATFPSTKFIVVQPDPSTWFKEQLANNSKCKGDYSYCTVPLPVHVGKKHDGATNMFLEASHLDKVTIETVKLSFESYYSFIRCIVPEKQILWVTLPPKAEEKTEDWFISSNKFWRSLLAFTKVKIPESILSKFIQTGIPYDVQKLNCQSDCPIHQIDNTQNPSTHNMIVPSVCSITQQSDSDSG